MRELSARERRLVAALLLVAVVAAVILLVIQPIVDGFAARRTARAELRNSYVRNARTIAGIPRLERQANQRRQVVTAFVLEAPDAAGALDLLRERAQRTIEPMGGDLRGASEIPAPPGWYAARLEARLTIEGVTRFLREAQNDAPFLVVDTMAISSDDALVTGRAVPMEVVLEVKVPVKFTQARS